MAFPAVPVSAPAASPLQRPPFGPSSLPTAQRSPGNEADAIAKVRQAMELLKEAVAKVDIASPLGEALLSSLKSLGKHAPATQADPATQMSNFRNMLQQIQQRAMLSRLAQQNPAGSAPAASPLPQTAR